METQESDGAKLSERNDQKADVVRCAICQNYTLKDSRLLKVGLGNCKLMPYWEYPSPFIERDCKAFKQVPESDMEKRLQWERGQV
jgi:hypothetical protein